MDAAINYGNLGGPLLDRIEGGLGINAAIVKTPGYNAGIRHLWIGSNRPWRKLYQ